MDINIVSFKFSDQELMELKLKEDGKLTRYLKCYNEATERTQRFIYDIDIEIAKRKLQKENQETKDKVVL